MRFAYYPGCTMYEQAKNFERSTLEAARTLGIQLEELEDWQCCGAVYPLVTDSLFPLVSAARNLATAEKTGNDMATLCSACYHVHKRTQNLVRNDQESRDKLQSFIEEDLPGSIEVRHLLEIIRDQVGFDQLAQKAEERLSGLKVASYYGCLLLRPEEELRFDDPEAPRIMSHLVKALGAEPVEFPQQIECCGAYLSLKQADLAERRVRRIVAGARDRGAQVIAVSCPLCQYNLDYLQEAGPEALPVMYFTQLLALGLGLGEEVCEFDLHRVDPRDLLSRVGTAGEAV